MRQNGTVSPVLRVRSVIAFLCIALALCIIGLRGARSQSVSLQRITNTTEEGVSLNPSLSGDGRRIAFESTEDLARVGGSGGFRALYANFTSAAVSFAQMGMTRAVAPAISQDGSRIAFASKDNPFGTNADGNSEIFFFDGSQLRQVTNTSPGDISQRHRNGNFQPSITDDGRLIAFSSNRDLAGLNGDSNLEIFIYDTVAQSFARLTNTAGTVGATDAKISGDGSRVAYIRDSGTLPGSPRDLVLQERTNGAPLVIADNILNLSMTYGRAISDNGQRVVYSAPVGSATGSPQVLLYDAPSNRTRQITTLAAPEEDGDVPLHPTISGNGSRIAFATRRNLGGGNSDDSVELYIFRVATAQFTRLTNVSSAATADVISSLSDDGSLVAFNFPRVLSGTVSSTINANNCEIYVARTTVEELTVLNGASFGNEPSETKAVAPDSIAVALGDNLATTTLQAQPLPDGTYPLSLGGTTVKVNNRPAQIFSVSPELVSFLVPAATETGTAQVVVTNSTGARKSATVAVLVAAPGVFTRNGDGRGEGVIVDAATGRPGPFDPTSGMKRLIVSATGVRNASEVSVTIGGRLVTVEAVTRSAQMPGRDEIRILLPADLRGVGTVNLIVRADDRDSNPVTVTISGQARRDIIINEVLADPPLDDEATPAVEGDANHDGVRDSGDDEFVELVNSTSRDIDISGYQLLTRSTTSTDDTLRHTFAPGTILPAGTAIVVFGGGSPPAGNAVFGGAQILTASKDGSASSLSLTNSGGVVTVREASGALVTTLSYGGSSGLDGDDDQSLTRSPDITGDFVPHQSAQGSGGRAFSPGTRVDGTPFAPTPAIARIQISPAAANIGTGARQQFIARAFAASGQELTGVIFSWQSSAPVVATIDQNGLATARTPGATQIRASARGVQSTPATLTVFFQEPVLTRIEVTPSSASVPPGGQQQFTARALDQNDNEMAGITFSWSSTNEVVATIDQSGLATGLNLGTTTIKATAQGLTGAATLKVVAPVLVINEALADPPLDDEATSAVEGDANHDGVRDSGDDEFVELVNSSNAALNISGWTVSTRPLDEPEESIRHTFAAGSMLPARAAFVIFGGGTFDPANPVFGCAQVIKASTGRLSLTNSGLNLMVRDASGNLFAQFTYGGETGLNGGSDQSLTRSPDINGSFKLHTEAAGANGRKFSPGTKVDGLPFGQCEGRLTRVTITPASASVIIGQTTQFTAQAFDQFGRPMTGIVITFTSSNTNVATVESVTTDPSTGITTATIKGRNLGKAEITARATDGTAIVKSTPATLTVIPVPPRVTHLEVTPTTAAVNRGRTQRFTAKAFNQNTPVSGVNVTWTSSNPDVATVDQNGLATGISIGTVTITATAPDGQGGTVSDQATLNVRIPLIINELLADPPEGLPGDANRDGTRDNSQDEFIELINHSNTPLDISGVIIADASANHFTFAENTTLAAGRAVVVFGGGEPPVNDPAFGGAQIFKAGSGGLSLNNTAETVNLKLPVGGTEVLIATMSYGTEGNDNQSLTRSPDITGEVVKHTGGHNAGGRVYSPGTRTSGTPFGSPVITHIQVSPASTTIDVGGTRTFIARAFSDTSGSEVEVQNVSFIWDASDPSKATLSPTTGQSTTATGISGGSTTIRARAGGQQGTATLKINFPPISRIEVTPPFPRAPVGGTRQFTAKAFDANNHEIIGVTFTWTSSDEAVATVDQNGLATALSTGTTNITASAQNISDSAKLNVVARTVVINEVLADPPADDEATPAVEGDANHDGVRDSGDDEFVELVNALSTDVNISGWSIRTRSLSSESETVRHTFEPGTTLPAKDAIVVFGGGTFDPRDPLFGGAQVVAASSGRVSLTNTELSVIVRDDSGNLVTQFSYGGESGLNGGSNQSLTRAPDITGSYKLHSEVESAEGRRYSPGRKVNGTFFVARTGTLTSVTITPASASVIIGQTRQFTAQAFDQYGQPLTGVTITFSSSNTNVATVESVSTNASTGVATAVVKGQNTGTAQITAQATDGSNTVTSSPATLTVTPAPPRVTRLEVTPTTATVNRGRTQQFTAKAFNQNTPVSGVSFTWTSSNEAVATVDENGLATGISIGTVTITATAPDGQGGTVSDQATLVVQVPLLINELLADVPLDDEATPLVEGDANRDGVRDSGDDEFIELFNNSDSPVDLSGVTISDATSKRFTFPENTTLAAGRSVVIFGGGEPPVSDPAFGGSTILKASSLGFNDTGDSVKVKLEVGGAQAVIAALTYGADNSPPPAPSNQSLTRSPDAEIGATGGDFVAHTTITTAAGRSYSPGTRVDGTPFGSPPITRIQVNPASATINVGGTRTFTGRAFSDASGSEVEVQNVSFIWDASDPGKAALSPTTGKITTVTGISGGSTTIRARAGGEQGTATLKINFPPISRIEVTPDPATIKVGGTQQFTAKAFDANNHEIIGVSFTWDSSNEAVATIDQNGLATAAGLGTTTITASAQGVDDTATLNVIAPNVIINELLADPPDGLAGDANHDGVRGGSDDEFVELANSTNAGVNISGWTIRTRSLTGTTENLRHTFGPGTTLPAKDAIVVFGGGTFDPLDPVFGGAQVVAASSGGVSLTNTGLTVIVRDGAGEFVTQFNYGGSTGLNGDSNQSLTRSPDITGSFMLHTAAAGANGRRYSPGRKTDGTFFVARTGNVTRVDISPGSASVIEGQTRQFTAQAFDQYDRPMTGVTITFTSSNTNVATVESVSTNASTGVATAVVKGQDIGSAKIRATATDGTNTVTSAPATLTVTTAPPRVTRLEVSPTTAAVNRGNSQQFTAKAFNQNTPVSGVSFTWTSSNPDIATVGQNGLATGVGIGTVTITATAPDGQGGTVSETATLVVRIPLLINELLADVPLDNEATPAVEGDANRDGVRDSGDDEFIELVNHSNTPVDLSGVTISDATSKRFTFAANTTLAAGRAVVVFGGGEPPVNDPAFGGSTILKASSLGFNDTGDSIEVELPVAGTEVVIVTMSYGAEASDNQSLTRSLDITGEFVKHSEAHNAAGRVYSPGTRTSGTPFGSPVITRIQVTPASATKDIGESQTYTARAFSNASGPEIEVLNVSFIWDSSDSAKATVAPTTGQSTTATAVAPGSVTIRARAGAQQGTAAFTINSPPPVLTSVTIQPTSAAIGVGDTQQFTAQAKDQFGQDIGGVTISFASNNTTVATVDSVSPTSSTGSATATVTGHTTGSAEIRATANNGSTTVTSSPATLTVEPAAGQVLISEFRTRGPNGASDEFVELYNPTTSTLPIGGLKLRASNASGVTSDRATIPAGTTLGSGCHYLFASSNAAYSGPPADQTFGTGITDDGGIAITGSNVTRIIDAVGMSNGSAYKEGAPLSPLTNNVNQSYERKPGGASGNGTDTNNNNSDFLLNASSSNPQNLSSGCLDPSAANLGITKTDSPDPVTTGSDVTYTITVSNIGPATAQSVVVTDNLTGTATITSCSSTGGGVCSGTGNNRTITFSSLASGASATITLVATANGAGGTTITNTATVSSSTSDPDGGNNSATATTTVQAQLPALTIDDVTASEGNGGTTTFTFTVSLSSPALAGGVTFDIATADGTAHDDDPATEDNDYIAKALTGQTIPAGQDSYTFDVTVNGDLLVEMDEDFFVNITNVSGANVSDGQGEGTIQNDDTPNLVISQLYGGGGNAGATFRNDFIELFNQGTTTVDLAGWSVQYSSAASTSWSVTPLCPSGSCLLEPGHYFLVQEAQGAGGTTDLPDPDAVGTIGMGATSGKVALVSNTTPLSGSCPTSASIHDLVGYGSTASCFEGAAPAPAPSNTTADIRKGGGCVDTNDNASDFFVHAPAPRNSNSPTNDCIAGTPPDLVIDNVTVTEGDSGTVTVTFTVSLSTPAPSTDVTFDISTQNDTATTANSDYVAKTLTSQVIPAGQQTYAFSVTVNGDTAIENDETFFVNVTNVSGATLADGQGVGTIQNDDRPALTINDVSMNEGDGGTKSFTFTVSLSTLAPTGGVTFDIATSDNSATVANGDYVAKSLTDQTIPAGSQTYDFDVTINGDLDIESNETFFVDVSDVTGATVNDGHAVGTIQNDDSPSLSIDDVVMMEGNSGTTTFSFTVSSSLPAPAGGITFDISTEDGTAHDDNPATEDNDYVGKALTGQTIPAGQDSYTFDVTVNGDLLVEADEDFFVNITNVTNGTIADGQGEGTIQNDDAPNLVISQLYGGGGNAGATFRNDFIELFNQGTTTVDLAGWSVQYSSAASTSWSVTPLCPSGSCLLEPGHYFLVQEAQGAGGTTDLPDPDAVGTIGMGATSGKVALVSNTTPLSGSCPTSASIHDLVGYGSTASCFEGAAPAPAPSNTTADIRKGGGCVDTNDNAADFFVHAPVPRNSNSPTNNCGDGRTADIVISDTTVTEGDSGTVTATFTVSLIASSSSTVTVDYATADGSATEPADYQAKPTTTLTFDPGETSKMITVLVNGDILDEPDETFFVNLSNASNAAILDSQGQCAITDNDVAPTLTINNVSANEGDGGATIFTFTVSLSEPALTGGVSFDIATSDNSATVANGDYVAKSLADQTIPAGSQTYDFDVTINGDLDIESNETFFVDVSDVTGATVNDGHAVGTIQNDDSPSLSVDNVVMMEGNSGTTTFSFTVSSSLPAPAGGITFDISTEDGTAHDDNPATEDNDYVGKALTGQTIPAGQDSYTFDVTVNGDLLVEADEDFFVNITNVSGADVGDDRGQGTIENDDTPSLVISRLYGGSGASGIYRCDFVEIFNRGTTFVNFATTNYSLQYAPATGNFGLANSKTDLINGSIDPGKYFLVKLNCGSTSVGTPVEGLEDATGPTNPAADNGKFALVIGTNALGGSCPLPNANIADFVGYGTASCSETSPVAALSSTKVALRNNDGCTDTDNNSTNFTVNTHNNTSNPAPAPRNSSSPMKNCP